MTGQAAWSGSMVGVAGGQTSGSTGTSQGGRRHEVRFHGEGTALFVLIVKNTLLTILTLGIYFPWAKTERRRFLWQNTEFDGQRFVYTGTGKELFVGYVKVLLAYLVIVGVPRVLALVSPEAAVVAFGLIALGLIAILPYAIYGSRAYLLSRTTLRGVRFQLVPGAGDFAKTFWIGTLLTFVTLGLYGPVLNNQLHRILTNNTRYGSLAFSYDGPDNEAFWISLKGLLLTVVTLGIYYPWFITNLQTFRLESTQLGQTQGQWNLSGGSLFGAFFLFFLGTTLTFGLAFPWLVVGLLKKTLGAISLVGSIDYASIQQTEQRGNAAADGLADALDVGLPI